MREHWKANAAKKIFVARQDPNEVVEGIIEAVDCGVPFVRLPIGRDSSSVIRRRKEMEESDFVEWMRDVYHGD